MEFKLNDHRWELMGFWPWVPSKGTSMEIGNELMGVTDWIPATVPGSVHHDLYTAGIIANPYEDLNSTQCEWIENRWWVYRTTFAFPSLDKAGHEGNVAELVLKGLDYEALIYWNGTFLGEHVNMYTPAVYDITDLLEGHDQVELQIILKHAPDEMGQIGKTSETFTQKSRFNYKWDFSTRLVNLGIWDDVLIRVHKAYSIDEVAIHTDVEADKGVINLGVTVRDHVPTEEQNLQMLVSVIGPDNHTILEVEESIIDWKANGIYFIDSPQLWYPNGYGEQPLYRVHVQLKNKTGDVYDERMLRTGIRKLEYTRNEGSSEDALPYTFVVNGTKIYIQGANLTPLDHLYGNVSTERYDWMVQLAKHANLNMLRVWGGGIIEKSVLYDLCDEHGIMIWQEFIQSSSGIDNIPSKRPEFLRLIQQTAITALKDRRNHVSLTVWSGGNELMSAPNIPSTYEDENLAMLKGLVEEHDAQRLFLPTSASGPVQYITKEKGVSHDVHGHWKYQGNPEHYEIYGEADHLFHSEFGVDGLSGMKSLRKFLSERHQVPVSMRDNIVWRHHGEWWDTYDRDTELFGDFTTLADFVDASQWMQAEGLRFILEANRRRQFNNSGSIIWQMNEPWPNVSCTNLIDYYMEPKMAYYWVKNAFSPNHPTLDYRQLDYRVGEQFVSDVYVHVHNEPVDVHVEVMNMKGNKLHEQIFNRTQGKEHHGVVVAGTLKFTVPHTEDGLLIVRMFTSTSTETAAQLQRETNVLSSAENTAVANNYFFSTCVDQLYRPALGLRQSDLVVEALEEWKQGEESLTYVGLERTEDVEQINEIEGIEAIESHEGNRGVVNVTVTRAYSVTNQGEVAALHVYPQEQTDQYWIVADDAYFTLLPGESRIVQVTCTPRGKELFQTESIIAGTDKEAVNGSLDRDAGGTVAGTIIGVRRAPVVTFGCFGHEVK